MKVEIDDIIQLSPVGRATESVGWFICLVNGAAPSPVGSHWFDCTARRNTTLSSGTSITVNVKHTGFNEKVSHEDF